MSAIKLTQEELQALTGLPSLALRVYILGIRPYMDYRTGLVGVQRRISWQSLREACHVEPHQGLTDTGTPSKSAVRRSVDWLNRSGLTVECTQGKRLIFHCPMAHTDSSGREKPGTNPTQTRHSEPGTAPDTSRLPRDGHSRAQPDRHPDSNPTPPVQTQANTPLVSGLRREAPLHTQEAARPGGAGVCEAGLAGTISASAERSADAPEAKDREIFERFWAAYPRKVKRREAYEIFRSRGLRWQIDAILSDIACRQLEDRRWIAGYIPNPGNYLREERWKEPIERGRGSGGAAPRTTLDEHTSQKSYQAEVDVFAAAGFETDPDW